MPDRADTSWFILRVAPSALRLLDSLPHPALTHGATNCRRFAAGRIILFDDTEKVVIKQRAYESIVKRSVGLFAVRPIGSSEQVRLATLWSALTCQRFGLRRLDAGAQTDSTIPWSRQVATGQSADRAAHS